MYKNFCSLLDTRGVRIFEQSPGGGAAHRSGVSGAGGVADPYGGVAVSEAECEEVKQGSISSLGLTGRINMDMINLLKMNILWSENDAK